MSKAEDLYRLQTIDLEIEQKTRCLEEVKASLSGNEEVERARLVLQESEKELSRWRTKLRDQELEMRSLTNKIASVEDRLYSGRIKNPKELASLQEESLYLERRKGELEDRILESMIEVEEGEARVGEQKERLARLEAKWQATQARLIAEQEELTKRLSQLQAERIKLRKTIQAEDLALYEDLRRRKDGIAVALLEGELCRGCGVTLPASKVQQARQGNILVLCGSCERILYAKR